MYLCRDEKLRQSYIEINDQWETELKQQTLIATAKTLSLYASRRSSREFQAEKLLLMFQYLVQLTMYIYHLGLRWEQTVHPKSQFGYLCLGSQYFDDLVGQQQMWRHNVIIIPKGIAMIVCFSKIIFLWKLVMVVNG